MAPRTNYSALSDSEHIMLQHIIQIPEEFKLQQWPKCCIYNVPLNLRKANEEAYTPQLISIGPFHHGKQELQSMEKEKQRYFHFFSERLSHDKMDSLQSYTAFLEGEEEAIRLCYSEQFPYSKEKLVEMIFLDAVFIMELFLRISYWESKKSRYGDDYMITRSWLRKSIQRDLLLLENQLPIFVLEKLYETVVPHNDTKRKHPNFLELAGEYFKIYDPCNSSADEPKPVLNLTPSSKSLPDLNCDSDKSTSEVKFKNWNDSKKPASEVKLKNSNDSTKPKSEKELKHWNQSKHFTDLIRYFYLPEDLKFDNENPLPSGVLKTATQLNEAGVTFEKVEDRCLLDIKFDKNRYFNWCLCLSCLPKSPPFNIFKARLVLPQLKVDHTTECVFRNLIAFEQCHYPEQPYICNYVSLIDSLIHTKDDVELLVEREVISHELGSHKELATLVNGLCKFVVVNSTCYRQTIDDLNGHYRNIWNRTMAALRLVYFRDPWRASSTVVGVAVLVFTLFNFCRNVQLLFYQKKIG